MRARGTGRMVAVALTGALAVGGCSLLFDGKDLRGKDGGGDMGAGGTGGTGGGGGDVDMAGGGGTGGGGGGGGATSCTPLGTVKFTVSKPSVAANGPYEVAVADLDNDGKLDIVTANYNSNSFSVLLGDGKGAFALAPSTPVTTCNVPQLVVTADVTGDALPDVIVSCFDNGPTPSTANVNVYVNQSTPGTVKLATAKPVTLATQMGLPYLAVGKFNGDTKTDLVLVDPNDNTARIYTGNGDGTFTAGPSHVAGSGASWTTVGNLNGDGIDDILIYNENDETMTMLLSSGTTFTSTRLAYNTTSMSGTLYFVYNPPTLVDINHDGLLDILVASGTSQPGTVEKFLNSGTATAPAFPATPADVNTGDLPVAQGFADFNCDGTLDIAVSTNGCDPANAPPSCPNNMLQPPSLWILPGHGTGYDAALTTGIPLGADSLAIADVNGDGYPDIVAGAAGTTVTVLINTP